ncbi:MAG: hypothetical protein WD335_01840 [Candidatus Paceibacterota bacterium]
MSQYIYSRIYRKRIFITLITLFVLSAGLYGFFLQQTISHVVERTTLDNNIASLHSQIGDAEYNYGSSISSITMDKALALGFTPVDSTTYVTRADRGTFVSLNVSGE